VYVLFYCFLLIILLIFFFQANLCWFSEEWEGLRKVRGTVLNENTATHYFGYAKQQLMSAKKEFESRCYVSIFIDLFFVLEDKEKASKKLYHTTRLLFETKRIVEGKDPIG